MTKDDCLGLIWDAGIEMPELYKLGFNHNNCLGCCKGGMGYWNAIRKHFPERFEAAALVEREVRHSILSDADGSVWLDELDPERGRMQDEPDISCGIVCNRVSMDFATAE